MATNSLFAMENNSARQIEYTINGIKKCTGDASPEEIAMILNIKPSIII